MATQTLSDKLFSLPVRLLRGDWLLDGYINASEEIFRVVILDGTAYSLDALEYGIPAPDCALDIDADGTIGEPGARSRFSVTSKELQRVGLLA